MHSCDTHHFLGNVQPLSLVDRISKDAGKSSTRITDRCEFVLVAWSTSADEAKEIKHEL